MTTLMRGGGIAGVSFVGSWGFGVPFVDCGFERWVEVVYLISGKVRTSCEVFSEMGQGFKFG